MAGDGESSRKQPTIPSWQQDTAPLPSAATQSKSIENKVAPRTDLDPIEQARLFLQKDEIKSAPRERKIEFLEKKGLQADDIQKVLSEQDSESTDPGDFADMQTVFDSTNTKPSDTTPSQSSIQPQPSSPPPQPAAAVNPAPKQDLPPVITYPEFLLKPQKPPPLVTIERLVNAGYILAGISALTWGASKYLVAPMRDSLTSARHDLQSSSLNSLSTLNTKLESTVSHIPYIPPLVHHKHDPDNTADAISSTSSDSDPTELFHRDIATQTSPTLADTSRRSSLSSLTDHHNHNPTTSQAQRLTSLHSSLSSLLSSTTTTFSTSSLSTSISDLQGIIDKIESNPQPLYSSYNWHSPSGGGGGSGGNSAAPAWTSSMPGNTTTSKSRTDNKRADQTEAAKFKAEIRALKGAFLSSRNFPTARPVVPGGSAAGGGGGGGGGSGAAAYGTGNR